MKKRLLGLFLCMVTVLALALTGCSDEGDVNKKIDEKEAENAMTLSMWVVTEEKVDDAVAAEVTEAINDLTQANHKTKLVIKYLTEDEYYNTLTTTLAAYKETYKPGTLTSDEKLNTDEDGLIHEIYPALQENQVDIVYIGDLHDADGNLQISGAEMYRELVDGSWLAPMSQYLDSATAKKNFEFIRRDFVNAASYNGDVYALPNNNILGEYTYMLLNEELLNACYLQGQLNSGNITGFYNKYVYQFVDMILAGGDTTILPIDASYEECLQLLAYNWSVDPDTLAVDDSSFSAFGSLTSTYGSVSRGEAPFQLESLFANEEFTDAFLQLNKFRLSTDVIFGDAASGSYTKTAIKFLTGDLSLLSVEGKLSYYTDDDGVRYYAIPVMLPQMTEEDVFCNMFGICSLNTPEGLTRCMEIITYFNTDEEIRNLLQYGIKNEHYTLVDGAPQRNDDGKKYMMDLYTTGNAFIAYPESWMQADIWELGIQQNAEANLPANFGFDLAAYPEVETLLDQELLNTIKTVNERVNAALAACTTYGELEALVNDLAIILDPAKPATVDDLTSDLAKNTFTAEELPTIHNAVCHYLSNQTPYDMLEEGDPDAATASQLYSPYGIYYKWAVENKFVAEK